MGSGIGLRQRQNFRRHEEQGWRLAATGSAKKPYVVGHDVLYAKEPAHLPIFFKKVAALALGRQLSQTKARQLCRQAFAAACNGSGMTYRLKPRHAVFLKGLHPAGVDQWVAVEALKIRKKMQRVRDEHAAFMKVVNERRAAWA